MSKNFLFFFLLLGTRVLGQTQEISTEDKAYIEVFGKCFEGLKPLKETKNRTKLNKVPFCSLFQCAYFIKYVEDEKTIQESILKRALEISVLLYNQGTPIYLLTGMNSFGTELTENKNLSDDNNLVYIAVAECITSESLEKIKNIVNEQTLKLINKR